MKLRQAYGNPIQEERQLFRALNIGDCHGSYCDNQFRAFALLQNTNCIWHCWLNGSKNNEINIVGNLAEQNALLSLSPHPQPLTPVHNLIQWRGVCRVGGLWVVSPLRIRALHLETCKLLNSFRKQGASVQCFL